MRLHARGNELLVESARFTAGLRGAALVSVVDRATGIEFCGPEPPRAPLELTYVNGDALQEDKHQHVATRLLSPLAARVVITGNDSCREIFVWLDTATGDLCVRPAGESARRGVVAGRWSVAFARQARLVLPVTNGVTVEAERSHPASHRYAWPCYWNAQLAIAERDGASLMIHSEDRDARFKALDLRRSEDGNSTLGFESEETAPLWQNRNAGGVTWRLNTYAGGWEAPAARYREWLRELHNLAARRVARPEWVDEVSFAICWARADASLLESLAALHPPQRMLIHLSHWRTQPYDVGYPDYVPTDDAKAFLARANELGFRVMPHFNYFACYNEHPLFRELRDWQLRTPYVNEPDGWYWPRDTHDHTRMAYIHPGLARWRRTLIEAVLHTVDELKAPAAFIDQTLLTLNSDNGVVEGMNTIQGMQRLQDEFLVARPDLVLVGEQEHEMSFPWHCFAQAHILDGFGALERRHVEAAHPICSFLWEGHTRLIGYHHLRPGDEGMEMGVEVYHRMGAIPTLVPGRFGEMADSIDTSHPAVVRLLRLAGRR
jgi:hypothetical protein